MDEHVVSTSQSPPVGDPTTLHSETVVADQLSALDTSSAACPHAPKPGLTSKTGEPFDHVTDAPPFWSRHGRTLSNVSYHSLLQGPTGVGISLEDHSDELHEQSQACWASSVTIDEGVLVSGSTGIGAYVVWHCTITTLKGGSMTLRKRYSEFDKLRTDLVRSFPHAEAMIPHLPRKSVVSRFRPKFLDQRKAGLAHFLTCILLNPEFAASPVLKEFIFS
ncbi:Hypothetical protein R9X50_00530200 [Acrodontium crateriforme]|uniref:Endosomal/vacuolar adapter protein YPT35 n=1 Tax=Acrodontium crateriforme TaxID=150365 RepID=A0AAQ3M931_9PEZI|nr:Hypothetical protein R9X50_00530200 [Acrodontium crateriforme]